MTEPDLPALKSLLRQGLALSHQGSYERRMPANAALPAIRSALKGLRELVRRAPTADAWRTLALAEESLLHYPAALEALGHAIALSPVPDRKDLKRVAQLKQYAAKWESLGLTPRSLENLGHFLSRELSHVPCDHTQRHTRQWLESAGLAPAKSLKALAAAGGCCDCEVLANVV